MIVVLFCALAGRRLSAEPPAPLQIIDEGTLIDGPMGPSVRIEGADWRGDEGEDRLKAEYVAMLPYTTTPLLTDEKKIAIDTGESPADAAAQRGFLQNFTFDTSYMLKPAGNDLGMTDVGISTTVAVPFPTRWLPLLITPRFEATMLDGPQSPNLPPTLYDSTLELRWLWLLGAEKQWIVDLSVTPGWHGDYDVVDDDTFRIEARALGIWQINKDLLVALGVIYLDRNDEYNILPAAGLIWTPEGWRVEMVLPRPSVATRLAIDPADERQEYWGYIAAELGGGTWTITNPDRSTTLVDARDYRAVLGVEHKFPGGISSHYEAAYVFARKIDWTSANTPDFDGRDTVMFRIGLKY